MARPDVASVGQALGQLIDQAEAAQHGAGSSIYFSQTESHSFEQASLSVGLSTKYFGPTVKASFQGSRMLLVQMSSTHSLDSMKTALVKQFLDRDDWDDAVGDTLEVREIFTVRDSLLRLAEEVTSLPGGDKEMGHRLTFLHDSTGLGFDFELLNRSAADIPDNTYKIEGLVYADNELPRHNDLDDGWISIGDVDGVGGNFVSQPEDDDFVISISEGAVVDAIGFSVGDNQSRSGESITIEGAGFTFTFNDPAQIPGEGFVGFVAPFPIERVIFDEDAGSDDIAMRDIVFGIVPSGS